MFRRKDQQAEKDKTERVTGLGRKTREEIAKWNQMTALRFQTGGRYQTSPASLRGRVLVVTLRRPTLGRTEPVSAAYYWRSHTFTGSAKTDCKGVAEPKSRQLKLALTFPALGAQV